MRLLCRLKFMLVHRDDEGRCRGRRATSRTNEDRARTAHTPRVAPPRAALLLSFQRSSRRSSRRWSPHELSSSGGGRGWGVSGSAVVAQENWQHMSGNRYRHLLKLPPYLVCARLAPTDAHPGELKRRVLCAPQPRRAKSPCSRFVALFLRARCAPLAECGVAELRLSVAPMSVHPEVRRMTLRQLHRRRSVARKRALISCLSSAPAPNPKAA